MLVADKDATCWVAPVGVGRTLWARVACIFFVWTAATYADSPGAVPVAKVREFVFHYGVTINKLQPHAKARIWIPVAQSNHEQTVELIRQQVPGQPTLADEATFHNRILYVEAEANDQGEIPISLDYRVKRRELLQSSVESAGDEPLEKYLHASRLVPVDGSILAKVIGKQAKPAVNLAGLRQLYDAIDAAMRYDKPEGKPWGRGDAVWACDSKYGNCTDFHSVFIAACRDLGVPATFEIGFPLPEARGKGEVAGYHCWAKFLYEGHWYPVDISEADKHPELKDYYFGNLTADRLTFSEGRDLVLVPAATNHPVNFLIYPHVEVNGQVHKDFVKQFSYEDRSGLAHTK